MIRMVQIGIDHPHAAAYRGTLWALRDRIEVVGFLAREDDTTTRLDGPLADVPVFRSLDDGHSSSIYLVKVFHRSYSHTLVNVAWPGGPGNTVNQGRLWDLRASLLRRATC